MLDRTDSNKVKDMAISLLWADVKESGHVLIASHPFTDSWYTCVDGKGFVDLHNLDDLKKWRAAKEKMIEKFPPMALFSLVCKPYRMTFLKYCAPFMSSSDIGSALRETWRNVENISGDINVSQKEMVSLFRIADKNTLMTEEELMAYEKLPPTITVYRGVTDFNKAKKRAMSWTTSLKTAKWFSKRYDNDGEIWTMDVNKENILAMFDGGEHEIVVNPKAIKGVEVFYGLLEQKSRA